MDALVKQQQYKDTPPGPPDPDMEYQGMLLDMALRKGRQAGMSQFITDNEKQLLKLIDAGNIEQTFWPEEPKATTEKFEALKTEGPSL